MNKGNIAKHSELLFIWDAKMTNPNGDMLNDNAPRFDEVDSKAIVSDVRVKRTIRDDLQNRKKETIFVNNAEEAQKAETRLKELVPNNSIQKVDKKEAKEAFLSCIDNRLFGGVAPESRIQLIGPVQFSWAKSLNETETIFSQGTGAFASKDGAKQKTFRTDNYIPYGLFAMYGVTNDLNAEKLGTTEEDISKMLDSMWNGTKLLNTRSKTGQKPRILIRVLYKDSYFIGLLDEFVTLNNENSNQIRKFEECDVNFYKLIKAIELMTEHVEKVLFYYDQSASSYKENFQSSKVTIEHIQW